jgi:hypothetical protein
MEAYRNHIKELTDLLVATTPPEVRTKREKGDTCHTKNIALII